MYGVRGQWDAPEIRWDSTSNMLLGFPHINCSISSTIIFISDIKRNEQVLKEKNKPQEGKDSKSMMVNYCTR